jgi:hypothetical protein
MSFCAEVRGPKAGSNIADLEDAKFETQTLVQSLPGHSSLEMYVFNRPPLRTQVC